MEIVYREPTVSDASAAHELVAGTEELDLNSWYYYALMFRDFADTSMVVTVDDVFAGFVTGFVKPGDASTLFLWQTATTRDHGVAGLGLGLLTALVESVLADTGADFVEATVDPGNKAIGMQFRLLARALGADRVESPAFDAVEFAGLQHDEMTIRIGPLR
ncbi:L-2,4-diaminobutyric acid acetyltransferase [Clavibacter michiganensis]|uniref:L-2,4-diaminobutyric acid acetyltransferase n=1 Tax=Clavibacter michiganensis TaxID=28447 RepID=A0A251YEH3_9MICO|nr:diaminobutyrate acetyltransferase [Clavibacter michiganensis]OUE22650.1 L-2,4-diaminobutyric acid acetyltransferase [Clavibacter michiganensis]